MLKSAIHCLVLAAAISVDNLILGFPLATYTVFGILVYLELFKVGRSFDYPKNDLQTAGKLCLALVSAWVLNFALLAFPVYGSGNGAFGLGIFLCVAIGPILLMMGIYALVLSISSKIN